MASVDLQWELVRKYNRFMVKRSGYTFSTEPTNLAGVHSYKFSGLAQHKVVAVCPAEKGASVSLRSANRCSNKVARSMTKPVAFQNSRRAAKALETSLAGSHYRPDLTAAAKARVSVILASQKTKKIVPKKMRANKLAKISKKN